MQSETASPFLISPSGEAFTSPLFLLFAVFTQGQKIASSEKNLNVTYTLPKKSDLTSETALGCNDLEVEYCDIQCEMWISPDPDGNWEFKNTYADGSSSELKFWELESDGTRTIFSFKVIGSGYEDALTKKWDYTAVDGEETHVEAAYTAKVDVMKIGLNMKDGVVNGALAWDFISSELSLAGNKPEVGSGFKASVKSGL